MKIFQLLAIATIALLTFSCKKDKDTDQVIPNPTETEALLKVIDISNQTHDLELFTQSGDLQTGYNPIFIRVKNKITQAYESNVNLVVKPLMYMTSMQHSCPVSDFTQTANKTNFYDGFIIFQMAGNTSEYWELTINYSIAGVDYSATSQIVVNNAAKRRVTTFTGTDNVKYILALVNPANPKVGTNNIQAALYKMNTMMSFLPVNDFTVKIDPRMPSMGNHGSPNNTDLSQTTAGGFYNGKLALTMTGYWKINLQVENTNQEVLKGEEITGAVEASSIFFEIEF